MKKICKIFGRKSENSKKNYALYTNNQGKVKKSGFVSMHKINKKQVDVIYILGYNVGQSDGHNHWNIWSGTWIVIKSVQKMIRGILWVREKIINVLLYFY